MSISANRFYVTGATLRPDAPSYVERQADRDLYEGLSRGEFGYVLTARQMGKSSRVVRTAARRRAQGLRPSCGLTGLSRAKEPGQGERGDRR